MNLALYACFAFLSSQDRLCNYCKCGTKEIKQHYPTNTIIKDKMNSYPTTMLADSWLAAIMVNEKLIE